jgi:hypothetical protein
MAGATCSETTPRAACALPRDAREALRERPAPAALPALLSTLPPPWGHARRPPRHCLSPAPGRSGRACGPPSLGTPALTGLTGLPPSKDTLALTPGSSCSAGEVTAGGFVGLAKAMRRLAGDRPAPSSDENDRSGSDAAEARRDGGGDTAGDGGGAAATTGGRATAGAGGTGGVLPHEHRAAPARRGRGRGCTQDRGGR